MLAMAEELAGQCKMLCRVGIKSIMNRKFKIDCAQSLLGYSAAADVAPYY